MFENREINKDIDKKIIIDKNEVIMLLIFTEIILIFLTYTYFNYISENKINLKKEQYKSVCVSQICTEVDGINKCQVFEPAKIFNVEIIDHLDKKNLVTYNFIATDVDCGGK